MRDLRLHRPGAWPHRRQRQPAQYFADCLCARNLSAAVQAVTEDVVAARFAHRKPTSVRRYELPKLYALNFVLDDVLDGGVTQALNLDSHGKTLSYHLLGMRIAVPDELMKFAHV